ncbi:single-stranded DNA-binding protein (plasmid) [Limosilactobacillus mucosae]|uniref:single-stranded DNA-binding protein n=1 Tax=Limosilactobacillus mucosae TaxID=97478 RepID=UPI0015D53378|nr:single-stranded DNA-binding protein [Limosilactobacillus mucosae]QLI94513.1 single-stranded DNA-binding protein [Limosilactobacillus mucosae]QLI95482.1 single-stranded DNA-binding protein [Limosilactobacillus mucosae]
MINNVTLTGRITKGLEKHQTNKGTSVVNFSLAVDRRFKDSNGNREADFISIQAWGMTADLLCKYCGKGSLIGIEGRIQTRNYENNQGQRVYVTEVVAENVTFLDSKKNNDQGQQGGYQQSNGYQNDSYQQTFDSALPFDNSADDVPF